MKREEERNKAALEAYPEAISYSTLIEDNIDYNKDHRDIWLEGAEWADKQLTDYLQREWDKWAGACSTIVSMHCREVERMANDLGVRLKFNNPYIE